MRQLSTLDLGRDVHKDSMAVAYVAQEHGAEVTSRGTIGTRQGDRDQLIRRMPAKATHLLVVYDAGPCGSWLSRDLPQQGYDGWVVAPSLLPKKPGERVNTERRDAVPLARLARSGDRPAVDGPTVADEARRERPRAREDTLRELQAAKCRLQACWLRHDIRYTGRATWGPAHLRWLSAVVCPTPPPPIVFQADVRAVPDQTARLQRREQARHDQVKWWRLPPVVEALQALRGVQGTVAVTRVADSGDRTRFATPRELLTCLGLLPAASSAGEPRRQGALTKAGHAHARRALVEGAWASRHPAQVSRHRQRRLEPPPKVSQDLRWKAQVRRGQRDRRLVSRGQHPTGVTVAMARERAGCMGAMAKQVPVPPSSQDA